MVQTDTEVLEDEIEFIGDAISVLVSVVEYVEEYKGQSNDEEYFERIESDGRVIEVECPLQFVYADANPSEEYTGSDAVEFIESHTWDRQEMVDIETMELERNEELYLASFDCTELAQYQD